MNITEYEQKYGHVWRAKNSPYILEEGMLQFDETASWFAGPFDGNYAYFCVCDHRSIINSHRKLRSIAEERQRIRFSTYGFPAGYRGYPAQNEEQLQKRLATLTEKERKYWQKCHDERKIDIATIDCPFSLYLAGDDDASYTKFYQTLETLNEELQLFKEMEPLNYQLHIAENGFVFTN